MEGISSTWIENSVQFLRSRDKYKSNLLDDSRLTKAAGLAAQKELLLESPARDTWKEPRLKSVNRELQHASGRVNYAFIEDKSIVLYSFREFNLLGCLVPFKEIVDVDRHHSTVLQGLV